MDDAPEAGAPGAAQLRALVENGNEILALVSATGVFVYVSPSVEAILGYRPEELVGESCLGLTPDEQARDVATLVPRLLAAPGSRECSELCVRHADGSWRELETTAVNRVDDEAVSAIVVAARDIGDRKRMERALAESAEEFRLLADNAHDIIARYSLVPEPRMVYISPSVERLTGYSPNEFYENPHIHIALIHPDDRERLGVLMQRPVDKLSVPITLRWVCKDGEIVWLEQLIVPIVDDAGRLVGTESISREVTAQIRLEEQLRRARKLEAVGRLAGGIAHDFNNLLGVMMLSADRLKKFAANPVMTRGIDMILSTTERGADLVKQLLTFSRRAPTHATTLRLSEVVSSMQPMLRRLIREDIVIETELSAARDSIEIDRSQLEQIILNLAINARDAMPQGGTLTLATVSGDTESVHAARGDTSLALPAARVTLVVADTGEGLSEEQHERIFEPFFTTKPDGSGLGLSVVYGAVKDSGGNIDVDSEQGRGTRFRIDWPVVSSTPAPRPSTDDASDLSGSETILLVEDEPILRELTAEMMERYGYRVLVAGDAAEAERIGDETRDDIALLLTDVVLPGDNGRVLAERLSQRRPGLRVVFVSGYTDDEVLRQGLSRESIFFVSKPFTESQLMSMIRRVLSAD